LDKANHFLNFDSFSMGSRQMSKPATQGKGMELDKLYEDPHLEDDMRKLDDQIEEKRLVDAVLNQEDTP
jgi:hypothetical protein